MSTLSGFLTADLIGKIDAYLCKAIRWGYNGSLKMLSEILHDADMKLFRSKLVLHKLQIFFDINYFLNENSHSTDS